MIKLCLDSEPWRTSRNLLLCVPAAPPAYYSDQILYPFRQNTDFNYLCGYPKPNCVLILFTESGKEENFKSILFVPQPFEHQRIWDGEFEGEDSIARSTGVDEVKFTKDIASFLSTFVTDNSKFSLWYNYQKAVNPDFHKSVMADFLRQGKYKKLESCDLFVQSLRVVKSSGEIALIRKSMEITEAAFAAVDHMIDEWQSKRSKVSTSLARKNFKCDFSDYRYYILVSFCKGSFQIFVALLFELIYTYFDTLIKHISSFPES